MQPASIKLVVFLSGNLQRADRVVSQLSSIWRRVGWKPDVPKRDLVQF